MCYRLIYPPRTYKVVKLCCVTTSPPDGSVLEVKVNDPNDSFGCSTESSSDQVEEGEPKYYNDASSYVSQSVSGLREPMRADMPVSVLCRRACGLYINRWICTDYTDTS